MLETMAPALVGKDPARIEHHYPVAVPLSRTLWGRSSKVALSAIDIALWDIKGNPPRRTRSTT